MKKVFLLVLCASVAIFLTAQLELFTRVIVEIF